MKRKLYYSIGDGGDGSVFIDWFDSAKLADFREECDERGWGESCTGSIEIETDGTKIHFNNVVVDNKYSYFINKEEDEKNWKGHYEGRNANHFFLEGFLNSFFPNGLPKFEVDYKNPNFIYKVNNQVVCEIRAWGDLKHKQKLGK